MIGKFKDFFEPEVASRLGRLNLVARQAVEGFITGLHKSPHLGFAIEFAEHRPYTPGDEIRRVDWLAYARTDRFYVKLHEQQTNLRCQIILDASKSMDYASGPTTKFQYARYLAALLSYLMLSQQDAVGLSVFDDVLEHHFNPSAKLGSLQRIFDVLDKTTPKSTTALVPVLHELADRLKQRGMIVLLSDLLDEPENVLRALRHFTFKRHQVIVFHILDPAEIDFPFVKLAKFVDPETGLAVLTDPQQVRGEYLKALGNFLTTYRRQCADAGIEYIQVNTAQRYDQMLVSYLAARRRTVK
ncbi:MAG: DUF58 domain-containing protein [Phycisphaerae bacterium]